MSLRRIRLLAATWGTLACLLALVAPMWLGPAMSPLVRALGGTPEHHCACGMKRGQCGCAECEAAARREDRDARSPIPVLSTHCLSDDSIPTAPALPVAAPGVVAVLAAPPTAHPLERLRGVVLLDGRDADAPPTPPPRDARV